MGLNLSYFRKVLIKRKLYLSTGILLRWFKMFQKDHEKISNFAIDHKFQFSKIPSENWVARLITKYVQIVSSLTRDVKKTRPHGYPWIIPATRRVWGKDFAPAGNGNDNIKYPHVKLGEGGDHYPHTYGYSIWNYYFTLKLLT